MGAAKSAAKSFPVTPAPTPAPAINSPSTQPVRVSSRDLLGSRGELIIEHDGREYRLRFTQNGKLLLTA